MTGRQPRKREEAIAALLAQPTIVEAARAVGVWEKTLRRWLQDPAFASSYRAARRQVTENALLALQRAAGEAVATLSRNLQPPTPASVQVRAALGILDQTFKAVELLDLQNDIAELKQTAGPRGERDTGL